MRLWGLTSLKSAGRDGKLEIRVTVDVVVLSPKSSGQARWTGN